MMNGLRTLFFLVISLLFSVSVGAQTQVVTLGAQELTTIVARDSTEGKVFLLSVSVPAAPEGAMLMSATMELVVDASNVLPEGAPSRLVTLEIAPLDTTLSGPTVQAADLRHTAMKCAISPGTDRSVRVDVTEFVRYVLDNPEENYGLAIGSFVGDRLGRFELKSAGAQVATLTIRYLPRNP